MKNRMRVLSELQVRQLLDVRDPVDRLILDALDRDLGFRVAVVEISKKGSGVGDA